jgi:carboxyl-terminal processing protease
LISFGNKTQHLRFLTLIILATAAVSCKIIYIAELNPASPPRDNTLSLPEKSFEVFWQTFEDQYAFFELRGIDWKAAYSKYRPQIDSSTSPDSLFSILSKMVTPFQDNHITILDPVKRKEFTAVKPSPFLTEFPDAKSQQKLWSIVDKTLTRNGFKSIKSVGPKEDGTPLFQYTRSDNCGYIRFTRCYVSRKTEDMEKKDAELAGKILDNVLEDFLGVEHVIIDVRSNEGGNDEFAYAVASRFATLKVLGHLKQKRQGGYNDFDSLQKFHIEPKSKFKKPLPLTVLTNDQTCSAADVFALIVKALPQVTLIGENSTGIYSDMYGFQLPNGFFVSLSNERYYSADMVCYEGIGMPVDHLVKNTRQDLLSLADPVLMKALESAHQ